MHNYVRQPAQYIITKRVAPLRLAAILLLALSLSACGSATPQPPTPTAPAATPTRAVPTATPRPATPTQFPTSTPTRIPLPTVRGTQAPISQLVSVGKYKLFLSCAGTGSPTVVMDAGLNANSTAW